MTHINTCQILHHGKSYHCSISMAMDLIGGKWKGVILYYLKDKNKRFSELRKNIPNITEMTLSLQLKQLEKDGLISRTVEGNKPPLCVTYALTSSGSLLTPILDSLSSWAKDISTNTQNETSTLK